jgi:hypothetical protein
VAQQLIPKLQQCSTLAVILNGILQISPMTEKRSEIEILKRKGIPKDLIVLLRNKAGNKCSFPGCNATLITSDGRLIGEICTIKPISANGPRFSEKTILNEYFSEENLIYLCPTHHRLIDIEPEIYTVDLLKKIKLKHEESFKLSTSITATKIAIPEGLSLSEILNFWGKNKENSSEEFWQVFFSNHPQIISLLYPNPIVKLGEKVYFGGKGLDNKGGNIGDYIYQNKLAKSIVIVEIKTPKTKILGPQYRTNSYSISIDLTGAIVQTLNYKTEIQRDFHRLLYESTTKFEIIEPVCFVICGNLQDEILDNKQMRSFDLFRNSLTNLFVTTYDELFEKLKMVKELI